MGWWRFTRVYIDRLVIRGTQSQERRYPGDWVFTAHYGDGDEYEFAVDYIECGICKFYRAHHADDMIPYLCALDYPMCAAMGIKLIRTQTLATGGEKCDFRFKKA